MEGLGINWKILLGQVVNFVILLLLLKRFAFKPFLDIVEKRRSNIQEGVKKSEEAEKSLQKIRMLEFEIRKSGERKMKEIIKEAQEKAGRKSKEIITLAEEEKERMVKKTKEALEKEIYEEKKKRDREAIGRAIALAERFLKEKIDGEKDRKFLEELISNLK